MNPITNMKNLNKMNDRELEMGLAGTKNSWHAEVKNICIVVGSGFQIRVLSQSVRKHPGCHMVRRVLRQSAELRQCAERQSAEKL